MSFSAFLKGETPEQFQHRKKEAARRVYLEEQTKKLTEAEHVLSILRTVKPIQKELTEKDMKSWREAIA